ncbi:OsmC family protein [Mucilaginibacter ginkgonis]|uniref:OsmC family protein n=1 Tax=Mucilaginibacter ginkgonis TaxID=2682091 RepID=A0A6I4I0G8_9SPHI|nr:OsmC family protein [Mucilaginibacter ginkgonis]QQL49645.1 OsmC family protein [Mucilaginibacter ginkgonis]
MSGQHTYSISTNWTGNKGIGTSGYRDYDRNFAISAENKAVINGSSDPAFLGDPTRYNPEEMLLMSLSSCHMLWYLHLCSAAGVVVTDYQDKATGIMEETANGSGHFTSVLLKPVVTVANESMVVKANELHHKANEMCFIARSVNFPVKHEVKCMVRI